MTQKSILYWMSFLGLLSLSSFSRASTSEQLAPPTPHHAHAVVVAESGSKISGNVDFTEEPDGMEVHYKLTGLEPNTRHGFHVHEKGKCDDDGKAAGKHFVKLSGSGTSADFPSHYAGDLPEIVSDSFGNSEGTVFVSRLSMNKANPIADRSIVIHGGEDDVSSKSTPRIACGVIRRAPD